jgi:hypothetical protein
VDQCEHGVIRGKRVLVQPERATDGARGETDDDADVG